MPAYEPVNAALRCLAVLREVSIQRDASIRSIQEAIDLNRPTIIRMLETLEHAGLVRRHADSGTYFVTGKTLELSMGFQFDNLVATAAIPILEALQSKIGWPSDVAIFDTDEMIVAATNRRNETKFFYDRRPGFRTTLLGAALGRAYIAYASDGDRQRAFGLLKSNPSPWNEPARDSRLAAELVETIRSQGYALTDAAYTASVYGDAVTSIGVPVLDGDRPIAALNATYLREAFTLEEAKERLLAPLIEAASELGQKLSGSQFKKFPS